MVARLDVVGVRQHDAAFQARAHFGDIVLETAQRGAGRRRDDDVLAREARVAHLADDACEHQQARGLVTLAGWEGHIYLGPADAGLDAHGAQFARTLPRAPSVQVTKY